MCCGARARGRRARRADSPLADGARGALRVRANLFLEKALDAFAAAGASDAAPVAVDVGCGSGRDAVHLALAPPRARRPDRGRAARGGARRRDRQPPRRAGRCAPPRAARACASCRRRATRGGAARRPRARRGRGARAAVVETRCAHLREPAAAAALPAADIVHGCRLHLDRPLLRAIAAGGVVRPGGLLIWSTFLEAPGHARGGAARTRRAAACGAARWPSSSRAPSGRRSAATPRASSRRAACARPPPSSCLGRANLTVVAGTTTTSAQSSKSLRSRKARAPG